ncbi:MAG: Germination protease [Firmicutes bacterium]|nr:Germination protease [candidate division NPL-UPA2 bacterium]
MRTDLAVERLNAESPGAGVAVTRVEFAYGHITRVVVEDDNGAKALGKPQGTYVTIECPGVHEGDADLRYALSCTIAEELARLLPPPAEQKTTLVVGLGNWNVTPGALGPKVVHELLVTRHLLSHAPESYTDGLASVCAVAPGVLGLTGIETYEIITGVVEKVKPHVVVAIDALASHHVGRVGTTIQMANTGINPGSGIGNRRKALSKETLGVPVIALGVPTVVYAATIAHATLDAAVTAAGGKRNGLRLSDDMRSELIAEVLSPHLGDLVVTPKEIDALIESMAKVIAGGINVALHPRLDLQEIASPGTRPALLTGPAISSFRRITAVLCLAPATHMLWPRP